MALNLRVKIPFADKNIDIEIPLSCKIETMAPLTSSKSREKGTDKAELKAVHQEILANLVPFMKRMQEASKIVIACDDNTRVTPVQRLLPPILGKIKETGKQVSIIVAGGSHRHMTRQEKVSKFGASTVDDVPILDHDWDCSDAFITFGRSAGGYDLKLNRFACEPGTFLIGLGNIVPHRVCGFSGGYKVLLPGLTCPDTMNSIHYMSARYKSEEILGIARNPVRDAINEIGKYRPIDFLVNTVLDGNSNISSLCLGDPVTAQYQGAEIAKQIYGVKVDAPADVVIADAVPESIDFWVCAKALTNAKSFVRTGGHLVVLAPCTEGWSPAHGTVLLKYGYHFPAKINAMVKDGIIKPEHLLEASHLAHIGEVLEHCKVHLISDTLDKKSLVKQGFDVVRSRDINELIDRLIREQRGAAKDKDVRIKIVRRGAEILPLV